MPGSKEKNKEMINNYGDHPLVERMLKQTEMLGKHAEKEKGYLAEIAKLDTTIQNMQRELERQKLEISELKSKTR